MDINLVDEGVIQWTAMPRGRDVQTKIKYSCNAPSKILLIDIDGNCYNCECEFWLPIKLGNILDFANLSDVWESKISKEIQQDIADKNYTFCAVEHCGITSGNINHTKYKISINVDQSCQLACPSCRKHQIYHQSGDVFDQTQRYVTHIFKLLTDFDHPIEITMSGNGDVLSSQVYRPILTNWIPRESQIIRLFTNGLMMKSVLPNTNILPHVKSYSISIDAGSKEVYEQVRKPGKFVNLLENLDWLAKNKAEFSDVSLNFCLQASNAHDIINFANLVKQYGFKGNISKIENWATFDKFTEHDVINNTSHILHDIAMEQLHSVKDLDHILLTPFLKNLLK